MLLRLDIHPHALEDLEKVQDLDRTAAIRLFKVLDEMKGSEQLQKAMLIDGENSWLVNIEQWRKQYRKGLNLWKIKPLQPGSEKWYMSYRIVYAYTPPDRSINGRPFFTVLAVLLISEFHYESTGTFAERILDDYSALG